MFERIQHHRSVFFPAILAMGILCFSFITGCETQTREEESEYVPISLFTPAYNALSEKSSGDEYDLNATIRVIYGLELARYQSEDFESFLDYLTRQDYRGVAEDVLEAQRKMFPVLQQMYCVSRENEDIQDLWFLEKGIGETLLSVSNELLLSSNLGIGGILNPKSVTSVVDKAFNDYLDTKKIKKAKQKELRDLKSEYITALQQSWPVFLNYKQEWESLCIKKDQAYLDLYAGRIISSYNISANILEQYPDDKDALLIQAMSLVNRKVFEYAEAIEAQSLIDKYILLYPTQTAPAFVIRGIMSSRLGNEEEAFTYFDHASIEYPRQAAALSDMLDAYMNRPYFVKTQEGLYFQQMYRSTISGFGQFSPNFQKAAYYERNGQYDDAAKEIYNHFFRRSNQSQFDYLLSDLDYCELFLHNSFRKTFAESSLIDVSVSEKKNVFGKRHLQIDLSNNTDAPLNNVRFFICYHLVGMYPGDYVVKSLPSVNVIGENQAFSWNDSEYPGSQIVYTRGILLTDNKICWVDSPQYRRELAGNKNLGHLSDGSEILLGIDSFNDQDALIEKLSESGCRTIHKSRSNREMGLKSGRDYLQIRVPRDLCMIHPFFALGGDFVENRTPEKTALSNNDIIMFFPIDGSSADKTALSIYGDGHRYDIEFSPGENETSPERVLRVW